MKYLTHSPFLDHDYLCTFLARKYSNEFKIPFIVPVGEFHGYDLASENGRTRIEVKAESTPVRTGNVAIEYWNTDTNKPSGILSTEANLWLHILEDARVSRAFELDIDLLKKLVVQQGVTKSNGRNSLCKIIPLAEFTKHAQRSFPIEFPFTHN